MVNDRTKSGNESAKVTALNIINNNNSNNNNINNINNSNNNNNNNINNNNNNKTKGNIRIRVTARIRPLNERTQQQVTAPRIRTGPCEGSPTRSTAITKSGVKSWRIGTALRSSISSIT